MIYLVHLDILKTNKPPQLISKLVLSKELQVLIDQHGGIDEKGYILCSFNAYYMFVQLHDNNRLDIDLESL